MRVQMWILLVCASVQSCLVTAALAQEWGTLSGKVVWSGAEVPEPKKLQLPANATDRSHCLAEGELLDRTFLVDPESKGIGNVFIYLKDAPKKIHPDLPADPKAASAANEMAFAEANEGTNFDFNSIIKGLKEKKFTVASLKAPVVIDQVHCEYLPAALAVWEDQKVLIKNTEAISHNVNSQAFKPGNNWNKNMAPNTFLVESWGNESRPIKVTCNVHPWMQMSVMTFDHPYFAVTKADGSFTIANLPAGEHTLSVRLASGKYIERSLKVKIGSGETKQIEVPYKE